MLKFSENKTAYFNGAGLRSGPMEAETVPPLSQVSCAKLF